MDGAQDPAPVGYDRKFAELIAAHCTDAIVFTDLEGIAVWANAGFARMSGHPAESILGRRIRKLLGGDATDSIVQAEIEEALAEHRHIRTEVLNYSRDGQPYWVDLTIMPIADETGQPAHVMWLERDISDRKSLVQSTERAMTRERDRRRERQLLSRMSEWLFAAQTTQELKAVVHRSMELLFPACDGALYFYSASRDALDLACQWGSPDMHGHIMAADCWALRRGRAYSYGTAEMDFQCGHAHDSDNTRFCLPIAAHGDAVGLLTISSPDVPIGSDSKVRLRERLSSRWELSLICAEQISLAAANVRLQTELQEHSVKDSLTGLWNRRWFTAQAQRFASRAQRDGLCFSLLALDADHFKSFNDNHGHDVGDHVLRHLSSLLRQVFGSCGEACRIGGEEFTVLCPDLDSRKVYELGERLRSELASNELHHSGRMLPSITISAGIAEIQDGESIGELMSRADKALYSAKAGGRDRIVISRV